VRYGNYSLYAYNNEEYLSSWLEDFVVINSATPITGRNLTLRKANSVSGTVTDSSGTPIRNVTVSLIDSDGYEYDSFKTLSNGSYFLSGVPDGAWRIAFVPPGAANATYLQQFYPEKDALAQATSLTFTNGTVRTDINARLKFAGATWTVTFNANGGTAVASRLIGRGLPYGPLPVPTRTGYAFAGWYTAPSGGAKIGPNEEPTTNITLYAHWTVTGGGSFGPQDINYKVTFNTNGGTAIPAHTVKDKATVGKLPTPTRKNYTFLGWYTTKTGGSKVSASTTVTKNITYYAHWQANNTLKSLKASKGKLSPKFTATKASYKIALTKKQASTKLTVAKIAKAAKIQIKIGKAKWKTTTKATVKVAKGKKVTAQVKVTIKGLKAKTYKVVVSRKK
jgi:uncharacterized repeat protein (TIGR02543 family)